MKIINTLLFLTCLIAPSFILANESDDIPSVNHSLTISSKNYRKNEMRNLKEKETLLKAILKNTDLIQLRDGRIIDLRDFKNFDTHKINKDRLNDLNKRLSSGEGGGTGAGG